MKDLSTTTFLRMRQYTARYGRAMKKDRITWAIILDLKHSHQIEVINTNPQRAMEINQSWNLLMPQKTLSKKFIQCSLLNNNLWKVNNVKHTEKTILVCSTYQNLRQLIVPCCKLDNIGFEEPQNRNETMWKTVLLAYSFSRLFQTNPWLLAIYSMHSSPNPGNIAKTSSP